MNGFLFIALQLFLAQSLVKFTAPAPSASTLTATRVNVPFVMPCGSTSYTNVGACSANWPVNSSYYLDYAGAADWRKWTGRGGSRLVISKKVTAHRISDVTILPSSSQPTFATLSLGYYQFDPYGTEDYDLGSLGHPWRGDPRNPQNPYDVAQYTNCYSAGLVSNCGQSITVPVSNTVTQAYHIAVGTVGAVNGRFSVHLSDSSAPDYVFTDTNALTGTATDSGTQNEQVFTLTMQSVAAGVTATISYVGANLDASATAAGIGIIAASMGGVANGSGDPTQLPQIILKGLGAGVYGSQVTVPNSSAINTTGYTTINVAHVDPATDTAAYQSALNTAANGAGGYKIVLADGFATSGTDIISNPATRDNNWIVTSCAVLPQKPSGGDVAFGQRVDKDDAYHCHIFGASNGNYALANDNNNASIAARQSHHFAWIGIEFGFPASAIGTAMYSLIEISGIPDGTESNFNLLPANYPHHFLFERCYIHGAHPASGVPGSYQTISGLVLNVNYGAVYDSYTDGFVRHENAGNNEGKAIWWNASAGPISIVNTHLEANSENVICCSQAQPTLGYVNTSNVYFGYNYSTKNRAEIGLALEKNHVEMKAVQGWTIEWSVFDNGWSEAQGGQCFALNSHLGVPVYNPLAGVSNILFQHNYCETTAGMSLNSQEELGTNDPVPINQYNVGQAIRIQDNWIKICATTGGGSSQQVGSHIAFGVGGYDLPVDFTIDHNTFDYCAADLTNGSVAAATSIQTSQPQSSFGIYLPGQAARRATTYWTNNVMPRPVGGSSSAYYGLMFAGINFFNNEIDMPDRSGPGGGPLGQSGAGYDLGANWFAALQSGNPKNITGLGNNYVSGCLLSTYVSTAGATCTPPPAITYPNPSRGADKPSIAAKYCLVRWGNRPDLVASKGCVPPS